MGIASGKADYQGAFGTGTTLRYTPTLSGVKEDVILDAYRGQNTFAFTLNTGNLSVFEEEGRYFIAPTADAEEKILISDTWVYDAAGNFEKGTLSVVQVKNGLYLLTVGASVEFLTDENTVYPVYIDPTLTIDSGTNYIEDTTIYAGKPAINYGTDTKLVVGTGSPSYGVGRAVVRIPGIYESVALEDMMPANILSATFTVRPYSSPAASQTLYLHPLEDYTWTESGATWNSITAGGYSNSAWSSATVGTSVATFNITSLAKEWPYGAYYPDSGFLIKLADNKEGSDCKRLYTTEYTTASYRPYATFTYLEDGVYRIRNVNSSLNDIKEHLKKHHCD